MRLSSRETARCTSDSEREDAWGDGSELVEDEGETGEGDGGIDREEEVVQVESADAGRREVCGMNVRLS